MTDDLDALARLVHEQRLAFNAELEHPFAVPPWEDRDGRQQELDMRIASAVAARAMADNGIEPLQQELAMARAKLARLRTVLLEGGQDAVTARRRALAIIGGEEESRG